MLAGAAEGAAQQNSGAIGQIVPTGRYCPDRGAGGYVSSIRVPRRSVKSGDLLMTCKATPESQQTWQGTNGRAPQGKEFSRRPTFRGGGKAATSEATRSWPLSVPWDRSVAANEVLS